MMSNLKQLTIYVLIVALGLLVIYDLIALILGGSPSTISYVIWTNSKLYPVIPFATGLVAGHLFWSQK